MTTNTLKILLSSHSQDGTERINHLFRNAGQATQTHRITSLEDLAHCLNDEHWDLALCEQQNTIIDMNNVLEHIVQSHTDTPVILLTSEANRELVIEGMSRGAQDVIELSDQEHLLYAANREVENLRIRRKHADLERSLAEVSGRFDTLMSNADDAVAYILDGMHVDVNEAYANAFGLTDRDEFLAIPVVDLISEDDQQTFKNFLRAYNDESEQELSVVCVSPEGERFDVRMRFAPAVFDDEKCTQLILSRSEKAAATTISSLPSSVDPLTGLQTRYSLVEQLDKFLVGAKNDGCLLYFCINEFSQLKSRLGLSGSRSVRHGVADFIDHAFSEHEGAVVAHYGEDSFTVLLPGAADTAAMISARKLCERVEEHIFDIDDQTAQCSCCVGVVDLSKSAFNDSNEAMDTAFLALEEARQLFAEDSSMPGIILYRPGTGDAIESSFDIRELVSEQRLRMMFQPVINLHGEPRESYESTLRMVDADGQEQSVDTLFQAINQKSGDTSLDKWLIVEGTKNVKSQREGGNATTLTINLTQNALIDNTFSNWLGVAMKAAQLSPECITLQFSEKTVAHYLKQAIRFRQEVAEWNFKFSLNEFGRSQESFKVLQHFKIDYAFVDSSFAMELQKDPTNVEGLKTVLNRLQEAGVCSVVPYVENAATLASLWQMNAHYIQGYYLQAPSEVMDYEFADSA
ncbi:MAG: EAL domain-containing protein [Pseudomonadota bacterium]